MMQSRLQRLEDSIFRWTGKGLNPAIAFLVNTIPSFGLAMIELPLMVLIDFSWFFALPSAFALQPYLGRAWTGSILHLTRN
jgi:hypothetical protein